MRSSGQKILEKGVLLGVQFSRFIVSFLCFLLWTITFLIRRESPNRDSIESSHYSSRFSPPLDRFTSPHDPSHAPSCAIMCDRTFSNVLSLSSFLSMTSLVQTLILLFLSFYDFIGPGPYLWALVYRQYRLHSGPLFNGILGPTRQLYIRLYLRQWIPRINPLITPS